MKTGYKVCDAMTKKPVTVEAGANLQECAKIMDSNHVGSLLIKKGAKAIGIISEQDIVRKVVARGMNPVKEKVEEVMEKNLITIAPDRDIFDALVVMRDTNIRHLPVVQKGQMVGLLTLKDILKIEPQLFELLVEKFEIREEARKPIHHPSEKEGICELCGEYSERLYKKNRSMVCEKCKKDVV
jgi:signal-transduction protein with cAMP-binding, CBS, and nucleotidyltransferase domain